MIRFLVLSLCLALCAPAQAAEAAPAAQRIFLSPSGEPFRGPADGPDPFDAWFEQADANHDGAIDRAEFRADAVRFFHRLDTDGDGVIDGFELNAYETKVVPELAAEAEGRFLSERSGRRGKAGRGARGGLERLLDEPEPVSGADFQFDGKVSLAEWMQATDQRFDLLDKNKTGRLTREAMKARLAGPAKPGR
ncbi:MAG: hypothetical protein JO127_19095 [Caulobacteraceae bacterium]|nr:hypothetical protein [Caulobacteraceae bacterium]